ncbi:MAG: bifunctional cytidylyltransferase/SDR family oxidoreductase [Chloroflexota bacterium]|nr:bifunctional cytidylyltransferase/SDR family oxidoreductase [Chloroflexota bacterium]
MPLVHAIVLAAGDGNRFGADRPKQFLRLAGEQILTRAVRAVAAAGIDQLSVVGNPNWMEETRQAVAAADVDVPTKVVAGGATRNESTLRGLASLGAAADDIILIHDGVRPLVPPDVVRAAIAPVRDGAAEASDTVIPSADTVVIVDRGQVVEIPERSRYQRGQTPQVFRKAVLERAYGAAAARGDLSATDDCTLVLRYVPGARIVAVAGDEVNAKITTRLDLVLADRMIQMRTLDLPSLFDPPPPDALRGSAMLVIGGTNGIGQAVAELAERLGARVEVTGRSRGLDVRDYASVEAHVKGTAARLGGLDHVVVTAGILHVGPLVEADPADIAEVVTVNLTGSLNAARAAYPELCRTRGSLTLFASSSFTRGRANYVAYSASKAALVNLAQGLADEWCDASIRVNAVSPERTDTPMRRRAFPEEERTGLLSASDVAVATMRLIGSGLTGQVVDVRRHEMMPVPGAG